MALAVSVVVGIFVFSVTTFSSSNLRAANRDASDVGAWKYAEAGLANAYATIENANQTGGNPSAANLLGCAGSSGPSDTNGPSNCATPVPLSFCLTGATCNGSVGTATVYGFFSGTNPQTFLGTEVPASTWLLVSTGFATNYAGGVDAKTATALVKISPLDSGAVASVWNHIFITAPLQNGVCALSFGGNSVIVTVPLYVVGNVCLGSGGNGVMVQETTQPVDVQIGGKLVLAGGSQIGADSAHPITSGVVSGGCTTVSVNASTTPCAGGGYSYWVGKPDAFIQNDAPAKDAADMANDYATFDPGPAHPCQAGTTPSPLASSAFDNDALLNTSAPSFELTPNFSYACISQSGTGTGYLIWNNGSSSITVGGITVPTKTLAINGSIFFDGNLTISQSATYKGTAVIDVGGRVTVNGNSTTLCGTGPPCNTNADAWQGSSSNKSMLTLVALASSGAAITFTNNSQTFQGSLWTQPTAYMTFVKNGVTIEGPISIGSFDATFNNATMIPLPTITNMPVGAPIPPNTSASIGRLVRLS